MENNKNNPVGFMGGFKTGKGRDVKISEESLAKAHQTYGSSADDDDLSFNSVIDFTRYINEQKMLLLKLIINYLFLVVIVAQRSLPLQLVFKQEGERKWK